MGIPQRNSERPLGWVNTGINNRLTERVFITLPESMGSTEGVLREEVGSNDGV
jgi:hypothetical protein